MNSSTGKIQFLLSSDNWYSALSLACQWNGGADRVVTSVRCDVGPDGVMQVRNLLTGQDYQLTSVDTWPQDFDTALQQRIFAGRDQYRNPKDRIRSERLLVVPSGAAQSTCDEMAIEAAHQLASAAGVPDIAVRVLVYDQPFVVRPLSLARSLVSLENGALDVRHPHRVPEDPVPLFLWRETSVPPGDVTAVEPVQPRTVSPQPVSESGTVSAPKPMSEAPIVPDTTSTPDTYEAASVPAAEKIAAAASVERTSESTSGEPATVQVGAALLEERIVDAFQHLHEMYRMHDHDQVAAFVLRVVRDLIPCGAGVVFLNRPGKYELYASACEGIDPPGRERSFSMRSGLLGFAVSRSAALNLRAPSLDSRYVPELDLLPSTSDSLLCLSMAHEGTCVGATALFNARSTNGFDEGDVNVLSYVTGAVAEYLDTALPSREAEFRDHEFEVTPSKKNAPNRRTDQQVATPKAEPPARASRPSVAPQKSGAASGTKRASRSSKGKGRPRKRK